MILHAILIVCGTLLAVNPTRCCNDAQRTVLAVPSSICGNTEENMTPMCNPLNALKGCSNLTVTTHSSDVGVAMDADTFLEKLCHANESLQLVIMSRPVIRELTQQVSQLSRIMASAIVRLIQQFRWSRVTIVADIADAYLLNTAEHFYRMANLSSDSRLLRLGGSDSEIENLVNKVDSLNLKIMVLSLRPHLLSKLLCRAGERHLVWPEYAWIFHSVEVSKESCGEGSILDGIISLQLQDTNSTNTHNSLSGRPSPLNVQYLKSCNINPAEISVTFNQFGKEALIASKIGAPSDLPPQYVPTLYIALFYLANTLCFIICTTSLVLYIYFRREPAIKATSVSLSMLIYIGCYLMILYLYIINSFLLPSFHEHSRGIQNGLCALRTSLHGLGIPTAIILSTLTVKLMRVYRLFNLKKRISSFTASNSALAMCVLAMSAPNLFISLIWATVDPYTSVTSSTIRDGYLHISVLCASKYSLQWVMVLLVYTLIVSVLLVTFAILTRKIKYQDFKDTKKVSVLSFFFLFTVTSFVFYWYFLRIIGAKVVYVDAVLHIGHCSVILQCQGLIFAPKLFPIIKERLVNAYHRAVGSD